MYRIHSGTPFGRPLRYRIEAMKRNAGRSSQMAGRKKIHGLRPFRRGFHVGSPLERFHHSLAEDNGVFFLRATNQEQRATAFPRIQMRLRRYKLKLTTTLRETLCA